MRAWIVPILGLLVGGCSVPVVGDAPVPLTWTGEFNRDASTAGHIMLLFDEVGPTVTGTMFYESADPDGARPRATYRIEGTQEDGAIHFEQKEIIEADLLGGFTWCLGSYDLALTAPTETAERDERVEPKASSASASAPALNGSYSSRDGCGGITTLLPADTL
jgi:hypothetical protein